jgi:iron complex outermembrane receptor protein
MRKMFFLSAFMLFFCVLVAQKSSIKDSLHVVLQEVTVSSIRASDKSAVSFTNVSSKEISKTNLGQDVPYLLSLTPNFITTSDAGTGIGYTGYRVRGTDANRVNVTVNGIPLNDSESHGVFFVNMPDFASSLSSVQIQRGVGTSTNGAAAFGASINMQTEGLNIKPYAELSSTFGSFNTNKNNVKAGTGLLNNQWAFDARLSNITSDGYIDRAFVDMSSYYLSAAYFGDKTTLRLLNFGGKERTYQAWNGVYSGNLVNNRTYNELGAYVDNTGVDQFYDNQTDNYQQTHYQLHLNQILSSSLFLNASAHYTRGKGYYEEYKKKQVFDEYSLIPDTLNGQARSTTDLIRRKWLDNHFGGVVFALNYQNDGLSTTFGGGLNRYAGAHYGKVIWVRNAQNPNPEHEYYRSNSIKDDGNIYLKTSYDLFKSLNLSADLQYRFVRHRMEGQNDKFDWDTNKMRPLDIDKSFHFFNPKLGVTYKIDKTQDVYASWSVANREPNRNNFTESGVNDQPVAETLFDTELGYRFQDKDYSVGINAYYMKYKNQLVLTGKISEIGELLTSNVEDSYRAGIEIVAGGRLSDHFRWDGNISISTNKILNYHSYVSVYDPDYDVVGTVDSVYTSTNIGYSPNVVTNSVFTYTRGNFEASIMSQFVGKQYLDNTSTEEKSVNSYIVNNLSLKYSLPLKKMKSVDFQILVNNLFNETYETGGYAWTEMYPGDANQYHYKYLYPQAGIHLLGSVTFKF